MNKRLFPQIVLFFLVVIFAIGETIGSDKNPLPIRDRPRPKTTPNVPHKQIRVDLVPQVHAELVRRTFSIPGIEKGSSFTPYPDAIGIWLNREIQAAHPKAFLSGREFSHFHPDGSLHAPLPPKRAFEAVESGWAIRHPWADKRDGWEGLVLVYTPQSMEELEVVFQLIVDSYNFVTGQNIQSTDYSRK